MSDNTGDQGDDRFAPPPTGPGDHPDPSRPQSSFPHPPPQQTPPPGAGSFSPPAPGSYPPPAGGQGPPGGFPPPGQPQQHGSAFEPPNAPFSQPGPGAQASGPPSQAKPKKRRVWPWLLLGIPLLFAVLIGGCSLLLFGAVRGPVDATNGYIANLDNGDYGAAFDSLCARTRSLTDREEWIDGARFDIGGEITDYNFSQVEINGNRASVTGTIDVDGATRSRIFDLVDEDGEWRVCFD